VKKCEKWMEKERRKTEKKPGNVHGTSNVPSHSGKSGQTGWAGGIFPVSGLVVSLRWEGISRVPTSLNTFEHFRTC